MMWIVRLALRRPYTFVVVALLVLVLGIAAIVQMPKDILPNVDIPVISVIWTYNGLSPSEMEKRIVTPSERAFTTTVNDVEHIESQSLYGVAVQRLYFQPTANVESAETQVEASAQAITRSLPQSITPPLIIRYSASNVSILQMSIHSDSIPEELLFDYATNYIRTGLITVRGAQLPLPYGGKPRSIMVDLDQQALLARGLSPYDVSNAINVQNLILPNGTAKIGATEYNVQLNSSPTTVQALNDIPIRAVNGTVVYVHDVAHVRDGYAVQQSIVRANGQRSVLQTILKNGGASTLDVINAVKAQMGTVKGTVPTDLKIDMLFDQSIFVKEAIKGVVVEATIAACLTALMILLFLGSLRSTAIVTISIPLSILCSILVLFALGETINIMTLGGLALAVGILVDDATVEIENIHRNLSMKKPIRKAILDGAAEIALPAFVSTLSICIVFVPVFFITGPAKFLFTPLAEAVIFAMLASYLISRTLIPTMAIYLLRSEVSLYQGETDAPLSPEKGRGAGGQGRRKKKKNPADSPIWKFHQKFEKRFDAMRDRYKSVLGWGLRHPLFILLTFGLFASVSLLLLPFLGRDFFPTVDAGQIRLHVRAPAGTRIEDTERFFAQVEDTINETIPASERNLVLDNIGLPTGGVNLAFSDSVTIGSSDGDILIDLKGKHPATAEIQNALRDKLRQTYPQATFFFLSADIVGQILNFGLPSPIDVQIAGSSRNTAQDQEIAQELLPKIQRIPGAVDVRLQQEVGVPQIDVNVDRTKATLLGFTQQNVANGVLTSLSGSSQTSPGFFLDPASGISYSVVVQTPQRDIDTIDALLQTPITSPTSPSGQAQQLSNMASINRDSGQANITHYNVQPTYDIYANVQGTDLAAVAHQIDEITKKVKLPRGTTIVLRGQIQSMNQSFLGLGVGMVFAVILVYALMAINFQSWIDPLIVVLALPGAFSGILWMLFATGTHLSVPALMGMIMGIGVATANSILLVTFANEQREMGKSALEAALEAGATRIRPVLMTATAMMIGMLPMALGLSEGGEQNAPLGRAVIGALLVATFVTLFVVPTLYALLRRAEPRTVFADEEREEAEFEHAHQMPFDPSLPPEVTEAAQKQADGNSDGPDGKGDEKGTSQSGESQGARNGRDGISENRFSVSSGDASRAKRGRGEES